MGGAGRSRSGDGLQMVSRANLVSRTCVYVDWRDWDYVIAIIYPTSGEGIGPY